MASQDFGLSDERQVDAQSRPRDLRASTGCLLWFIKSTPGLRRRLPTSKEANGFFRRDRESLFSVSGAQPKVRRTAPEGSRRSGPVGASRHRGASRVRCLSLAIGSVRKPGPPRMGRRSIVHHECRSGIVSILNRQRDADKVGICTKSLISGHCEKKWSCLAKLGV